VKRSPPKPKGRRRTGAVRSARSAMENKTRRTIRYFGYGANASPKMLGALIGRKPSGFAARLEGYELWIQSWREIPFLIRKIIKIHWTPDFRTYCISPKRREVVNGRVWLLTPKEHKLVREWEFWYRPIQVRVKTRDGRMVIAEAEMVRKPASKTNRLNGGHYKFFLNNEKRMLEIAKKVRGLPLSKGS